VYIDQAHQRFRLTTIREKEQSSNSKSRKVRGPHVKLQCTQTAYSDEYSNTMRPVTVLPLPYNGHLQPTPDKQTDIKNFSYLSILQKDPLFEFFLKKPWYRLGGYMVHILRRDFFQLFGSKFSRPSNFLFQTARGTRAILSECPFSLKKHTSLKDFFKKDHFKVSLRKNPDQACFT
jgi:hypothetical protein